MESPDQFPTTLELVSSENVYKILAERRILDSVKLKYWENFTVNLLPIPLKLVDISFLNLGIVVFREMLFLGCSSWLSLLTATVFFLFPIV